MHLTDTMRVELAIPARVLYNVVVASLDDPPPAEGLAVRDLLNKACLEPLAGLSVKDTAKLIRRIDRVFLATMSPFLDKGEKANGAVVTVGKMGMVVYYFVEELANRDIMWLHEGSPMAEALTRVMPFLSELFEITALDASAQKQGQRMLAHLQAQGYYRK